MRVPLLAFIIVAACNDSAPTGSAGLPEFASASTPLVFNTQVSPENEIRVEPVTDPVESVAHGHAQVKLFADNSLEFKITFQNPGGETLILGHIHQAPVGVNGPIVVDLLGSVSESGSLVRLENTVAVDPAVADAIREDPTGFYVNLHTTLDPQGAVRGQLP